MDEALQLENLQIVKMPFGNRFIIYLVVVLMLMAICEGLTECATQSRIACFWRVSFHDAIGLGRTFLLFLNLKVVLL
jgi:hypothetical protein